MTIPKVEATTRARRIAIATTRTVIMVTDACVGMVMKEIHILAA